MSLLEPPHNRNSQQKEMGQWRSRYFWEWALRYSTKSSPWNKQEESFDLFEGKFPYAQFQIPGIFHCPPFNFFNISLLPSRNLFKKKLCSFVYNSSDWRWIWFCQWLKQQENLWYLGYWNTNHKQKGKFTVRVQSPVSADL